MKEQIKNVSKYLKRKYPKRYTLTLDQVAHELLMNRSRVRELKNSRMISSLGIKTIATFIVNNPARKIHAV